MAVPIITTQLSSIDANAGNQATYNQNVTVTGGTSSLTLPDGSISNPPSTLFPTATATPAAITTPTWAIWFLVAAAIWFSAKGLK